MTGDDLKQICGGMGTGPIAKPPLGIIPECVWRDQRTMELIHAIARYDDAKVNIPDAWWEELRTHLTSNMVDSHAINYGPISLP